MSKVKAWISDHQSVLIIAILLATLVFQQVRSRNEAQASRKVNASRQEAILSLLQEVKTLQEGQAALLTLVQKQQEEEARAGAIRQEQLDQLKAIAQRTEVIAKQVPECFQPPTGACVKASAMSLKRISADQQALLERTTFIVRNPEKPGDTPLIVTPEVHPAPPPCVGIGNVAVLPGVLTCAKP